MLIPVEVLVEIFIPTSLFLFELVVLLVPNCVEIVLIEQLIKKNNKFIKIKIFKLSSCQLKFYSSVLSKKFFGLSNSYWSKFPVTCS